MDYENAVIFPESGFVIEAMKTTDQVPLSSTEACFSGDISLHLGYQC